jgi:(R)-2-hydroxy-4-methylpentanoate CoA-transferase
MSTVLEGIKVLEMGHWIAVPAAAAVMADWGAEVIKVEPLTGDAMRNMEFVSSSFKRSPDSPNFRFDLHNRGKKSIALNLNTVAGKIIMSHLIQKTDVFMSNYQVRVLAQFGLDYENLTKIKKDLVYAILTGYGTEGPEKEQRGFDFCAAWARSGIQHLLAEQGTPPPQQLTGLMDRVACMNIVSGVTAGLLHRQLSGKGQKIEFSLYHTGVWANAGDILAAKNGEPVMPNNRTGVMNPLWNTYRTKDGRWIQLAILEPRVYWKNLCAAIDSPGLEKDPRFADIDKWLQSRKDLIEILDGVFATRSAAAWKKRLQEHGCIFDIVKTPQEVAEDVQAEANGFYEDVTTVKGDKSTLVTAPVKFIQDPARIKNAAPVKGQNTDEILKSLHFTVEEILEFRKDKVVV